MQKGDWSSKSTEMAVTTLLKIPDEHLVNEVRQRIAQVLFDQWSPEVDCELRCLKRNISLLVRVMERPTFYEVRQISYAWPSPWLTDDYKGMTFRDMDSIASSITSKIGGTTWSEDDLLGAQEVMQLLGELADLIMRYAHLEGATKDLS